MEKFHWLRHNCESRDRLDSERPILRFLSESYLDTDPRGNYDATIWPQKLLRTS